jgi:hypothetical protein
MEKTEQAYRSFQRKVDRICTLILFERPEHEIESARIELRSEAKRLFPDKAQLYEIIYESRFCRLWEQFRKQGGDSR